jgi:hypothetical protein
MACRTIYLKGVEAALRDWAPSVDVFMAAAACLEKEKTTLARQVAAINAAGGSPERVARQTASRRQELANADRLLAQSWFNVAADAFNLSCKTDARVYGMRVRGAAPKFSFWRGSTNVGAMAAKIIRGRWAHCVSRAAQWLVEVLPSESRVRVTACNRERSSDGD